MKYCFVVLLVTFLFLCCACHPSESMKNKNTEDLLEITIPTDMPTDPPVNPSGTPVDPTDSTNDTDVSTDPPTEAPTDAPTDPTQPDYEMPLLSEEAEDVIKSAYIAFSSADCQKDELRVVYYGTYEGVHIAFVYGPWGSTGVIGSETVAGVEFIYNSRSITLKAIKDGEMLSLQEAFNSDWLSETAIHELWELYHLANWHHYIES